VLTQRKNVGVTVNFLPRAKIQYLFFVGKEEIDNQSKDFIIWKSDREKNLAFVLEPQNTKDPQISNQESSSICRVSGSLYN
jgi:hypothetical protein